MAKTNDEDFVTFLNSNGEEVSNDPRWKAKRVLEAAGMSASDDSDELREELATKDRELEAMRAQLAALEAAQSQAGVEDLEEEDDSEDEDDFTTMGGAELKAYAKENGHDIKGLKTVGEVRARLRELTSGE